MHARKFLARESGGPVYGLNNNNEGRSALKILREQSSDERIQGV